MSNYGAAAMESAYQQIKAERAPHWRASEHAAFEQGWKACQAHAEALYAAEGQETPADEVLSGRIVTASFETGEPWPCPLQDCECPEHGSPVPPKGTYVTVRLDDDAPVGLGPVKITRVSEARGEVVPDDRA